MAIWQGKSLRKPSGARAKTYRNKRNMEFGRDPADTKIGDRKVKIIEQKAVTRK
jgi:small subunit ribosomal protein S8e